MILPRPFIATQYFCVAHELGGLAADFITLAVRAMIEVVAKCDLSQPCLTLPPSGWSSCPSCDEGRESGPEQSILHLCLPVQVCGMRRNDSSSLAFGWMKG